MLKLLYFSPRECWPTNTGARLRDYHLAQQLARRCSVTYLGLRDYGESGGLEVRGDASFARHVLLVRERSYTAGKLLRGLVGPAPVTVLNYSSASIASELAKLLEEGSFDVVQIEGVHLVEYVPVIRRARSHPVLIADWHNIESELMRRYGEQARNPVRRMVAIRTARLLERAEERLLQGCDAHVVVSERERKKLAGRFPGARIHVVGNGVDVAHYAGTREGSDGGLDLVFAGSMDYHANVDAAIWFVREIWPALRGAAPGLSFTVVGRNPGPEVRALASTDVRITGTVDDVRPFYARALAVVVPLRVGSGTRLKILEAMAAGVPVISTRLGAEGLDADDGTNILLADTPQEFAAGVRLLLSSPETGRALARAGGEMVRRSYDWGIQAARLWGVIEGTRGKSTCAGG